MTANITEHTPEPWHIEPFQEDEGKSIAICKAGKGIIAVIPPPEDSPFFTTDEDHANARLIAAAPELLEALREAKATIGALSNDVDLFRENYRDPANYDHGLASYTLEQTHTQIDAAIAKATGKAA
jgi:hypothetical protein